MMLVSLFGKHESCKILNHVEERYIVLEPLDLTTDPGHVHK